MSRILTLNAGSSSLKFALYEAADDPEMILSGQVDGVGHAARLEIKADGQKTTDAVAAATPAEALDQVIAALHGQVPDLTIAGVGHRIVHGGPDYAAPVVLSDTVLAELNGLSPLAPLHQPHNLAGVTAAQTAFPGAVQVGCFDTAFHRGHPWVNDTFALPRHFYDQGVRRYGFHGLSYDYVTGAVAAEYPDLRGKRMVVAHLGNGASMCAVQGGKSIASTMGFSALDGLPMGTRSGQIDPGVLLYLMDQRGMGANDLTALLYRESGLLGLSGLSSDMRTLLGSDAPEAAEAIQYYILSARRELGGLTAILGGIDALVFSGGVGENAAPVRAGIAEGMGYLGIRIDAGRNEANAGDIGTGEVRVLVVPTDEERVIARAVQAVLGGRD
ncbi:MAG: acetate/propionate family kinase [Pseudomonadota bacterium]